MFKQFSDEVTEQYTREQIKYAKEIVSKEMNIGESHPSYYQVLGAVMQLIATNELARATRAKG